MKKKIRDFLQWLLYGGTLESYRDTCQDLHARVSSLSLQLKKVMRESTDAKMELAKAQDENNRITNSLVKEANQVIILNDALDRVTKEKDAVKLINEQICAERDQLAQKYKSEQKRSSSLMGTIRGLKHQIKKLEDGKA